MMARLRFPRFRRAFSILPVIGVALSAQTLPDGKGKDLVEKICTWCHGVDVVVGNRMDKDRWANTVDNMVARGASATDEEIDTIVDYLAAHFAPAAKQVSRINVNQASAEVLLNELDFTADESEAIVKYREKNGQFNSIEDLEKVPGLPAAKVEARKGRIGFTNPPLRLRGRIANCAAKTGA